MTGDKENFHEFDEDVTEKVKFRDGRLVEIKGKWSILFSCRNGDKWLLKEVRCFDTLMSNRMGKGCLKAHGECACGREHWSALKMQGPTS